MESKKQTAVEWLIWEMSKIGLIPDGVPDELYQQVIEMEKEQIIEAFKHGELPPLFVNIDAEQYYNETYNK